ncbi:MAG: TetR/AcrR family transcriptional regulator [Paracoccaceae bacterium]
MPRRAQHSKENLVELALEQFWAAGYFASSMDDLVKSTGVSRYGIYSAFGGKDELFLACFEIYQKTVVTPAFAHVEAPGADLDAVRRYFECQIQRASKVGLPGPGCFVANSTTEVAPVMPEAKAMIEAHNARLKSGFTNALNNSGTGAAKDVHALADVMVVFTNGFWAMSRVTNDAETLRSCVEDFLNMIEEAAK